MNCWEFKKCGRQLGGSMAAELGVCPAYPDYGRQCARTYCPGTNKGSLAAKLVDCMKCDFFNSEHYDKSPSPALIPVGASLKK